MENSENNNRPNHGNQPSSDQDASSLKGVRLRKPTEFVQGEAQKQNHANSNRAGTEESVTSKEVVHRNQHKRKANATQKNDVKNNSATFAENNTNKINSENKKEDGIPDNQRGKGMIDSLVGATYQQKLLIVILCHIAKLIQKDNELDFEVTSENQNGGIFDDIGFRFKTGVGWRELFIQAKHKADKSIAITWDDLTSTDKNVSNVGFKYDVVKRSAFFFIFDGYGEV